MANAKGGREGARGGSSTMMMNAMARHWWQATPSAVWDRPADWQLADLVDGAPRRPALLLIDAQESLRGRGHYFNSGQIAAMLTLLQWFRERCHPVIFKTWGLGGAGTAMQRFYQRRFSAQERRTARCQVSSLLFEFLPLTPSEQNRTVRDSRFNALQPGSEHLRLLREWNVNTVVLAGGFTEHCIMATAFGAFDLDFDVVIAEDAVGPAGNFKSVPSLQHAASLLAMRASVARITPSALNLTTAWSAIPKGSICPNTTVPAPKTVPIPGREWCGKTGLLGPWPVWNPQGAPSMKKLDIKRDGWRKRRAGVHANQPARPKNS